MLTRFRTKLSAALSLAIVLALLLAPLALADNVQNDVDSPDGGKIVEVIAGGAGKTVNYNIASNNGDGQNGCNASDATAATVTPNLPVGISANPSSLTFTSCGTSEGITFTAGSNTPAGDYEITVSVSDSGTGSYNTNPAKFTLRVVAPPPPSDTTPPVISYVLNPTFPDGSNGWYKSSVSLTWTVTENESPASLVKDGCVDQNITADQAETTYSCSATSDGGSAGPLSVSIKRDATDPDVSLIGGPADGASYYFGFVPAAPTCDASDATSGLDGACTVSGYSSAVGTHTVTASATDNAGNSATASATYTVLAWTLNGFYQPVDMNGVFNTVKGGSTVPLKFEVFAGPTELTATSVVKSFVQTRITCDGTSATDEIEFTTTGGTSLRYDATGGQFIQNWQTPKLPGQCYKVTMTTQDGSFLAAFFKLK